MKIGLHRHFHCLLSSVLYRSSFIQSHLCESRNQLDLLGNRHQQPTQCHLLQRSVEQLSQVQSPLILHYGSAGKSRHQSPALFHNELQNHVLCGDVSQSPFFLLAPQDSRNSLLLIQYWRYKGLHSVPRGNRSEERKGAQSHKGTGLGISKAIQTGRHFGVHSIQAPEAA